MGTAEYRSGKKAGCPERPLSLVVAIIFHVHFLTGSTSSHHRPILQPRKRRLGEVTLVSKVHKIINRQSKKFQLGQAWLQDPFKLYAFMLFINPSLCVYCPTVVQAGQENAYNWPGRMQDGPCMDGQHLLGGCTSNGKVKHQSQHAGGHQHWSLSNSNIDVNGCFGGKYPLISFCRGLPNIIIMHKIEKKPQNRRQWITVHKDIYSFLDFLFCIISK